MSLGALAATPFLCRADSGAEAPSPGPAKPVGAEQQRGLKGALTPAPCWALLQPVLGARSAPGHVCPGAQGHDALEAAL